MDNAFRAKLEKEIFYDYTDVMDSTGRNTKRYKAFFSTMNNDQFEKFLEKFFADEDMNIVITRMPGESRTFDECVEASLKLGIDPWQYVAIPFLNEDVDNPAVTIHKVLTGSVSVRRLMQTVTGKNSTSVTADTRNPETGQVANSDKHARLTDVEAYSLSGMHQDNALLEYATIRGDEQTAYSQAIPQILATGELDLDDIEIDGTKKTSIQTLNYYMLAAGYRTNLVSNNPYLLPMTAQGKDEKETIKR